MKIQLAILGELFLYSCLLWLPSAGLSSPAPLCGPGCTSCALSNTHCVDCYGRSLVNGTCVFDGECKRSIYFGKATGDHVNGTCIECYEKNKRNRRKDGRCEVLQIGVQHCNEYVEGKCVECENKLAPREDGLRCVPPANDMEGCELFVSPDSCALCNVDATGGKAIYGISVQSGKLKCSLPTLGLTANCVRYKQGLYNFGLTCLYCDFNYYLSKDSSRCIPFNSTQAKIDNCIYYKELNSLMKSRIDCQLCSGEFIGRADSCIEPDGTVPLDLDSCDTSRGFYADYYNTTLGRAICALELSPPKYDSIPMPPFRTYTDEDKNMTSLTETNVSNTSNTFYPLMGAAFNLVVIGVLMIQ